MEKHLAELAKLVRGLVSCLALTTIGDASRSCGHGTDLSGAFATPLHTLVFEQV